MNELDSFSKNTVPSPMSNDASDIIRNLSRMGVDERTIAASAGVTISEVRTITRTVTTLTPEDEELANAMRILAWTAFEEAMQTLIYGSPSDKQSLVKTIISRTIGLIGVSQQSQTEEMRAAMDRIIKGMAADEPELEMDEDRD